MADVLEKIHRLIALATSPNENEARSAALAAIKLIRENHVVLRLPRDVASAPLLPVVEAPPVVQRKKDLFGFEWTFHEEWSGGGNCTFCGMPCFRGNAAYVSVTEGGFLHLLCWTSRQTGKMKPGPAPVSRRPVAPERVDVPFDDKRQRAVDDFWDHFQKTREK